MASYNHITEYWIEETLASKNWPSGLLSSGQAWPRPQALAPLQPYYYCCCFYLPSIRNMNIITIIMMYPFCHPYLSLYKPYGHV